MSSKKNRKVKLCSIDFSSKKTGIAYFEDGEYKHHYFIDCSSLKDMEVRFSNMCLDIWKTLEMVKPTIVYAEETVVLRNAQTQWRSAIGILQGRNVKREKLKEQAIQYVKRKYDLIVNDDEADAICIGDAVINVLSNK